jgi:two-component system sensor histidine kinase VanS
MLITCVHLARIAKMMERMIDAVDDMYTERVRFITLPPLFQEVENRLNSIMGDIRENREAAKEAEQRKNDMLVYMAHDLKTPLTSVLGYITLLKDEEQISSDLRKKYLSIAWNKALRLENLINDFFEVTRMNLSAMTLECWEVNFSRMIEQIFYEFRPLLDEKNLSYELHLDPDVMLSCDVEKMERVLDNLIKNAINYSYPNTIIQVYLKDNGKQGKQVRIKNHGKTIPKEKLNKLFEQFFRMDSARSSGTGGTGLGLAIAKQIIELHGGWIRCESANEEITFIFNI